MPGSSLTARVDVNGSTGWRKVALLLGNNLQKKDKGGVLIQV